MSGDSPPLETQMGLLLRIRDARDKEAWQTFVDLYGPLIYHRCRRRGLQDADAAEVTQEVLLQVSQSIRSFEYRPESGRFRDWLGVVTINKIKRFLKKKRREVPLAGIVPPEQDPSWTEDFRHHILQTALARIRPHFTEPTWRAFELVWLLDRPAIEVAKEMGQKTDWVYMAKSRVMKRLRKEVQLLAEDSDLLGR